MQGFKVTVSAQELREHCKNRADYHKKRAETKENELPALKEAFERVQNNAHQGRLSGKSSANFSNSYHMENPAEQLENDIRSHKEKIVIFEFYSGHIAEEDYVLDLSDLRTLEIVR